MANTRRRTKPTPKAIKAARTAKAKGRAAAKYPTDVIPGLITVNEPATSQDIAAIFVGAKNPVRRARTKTPRTPAGITVRAGDSIYTASIGILITRVTPHHVSLTASNADTGNTASVRVANHQPPPNRIGQRTIHAIVQGLIHATELAALEELLSGNTTPRRYQTDSLRELLVSTPTPAEAAANAARLRTLHQDLIQTGAISIAELATGRDIKPSAASTWFRRAETDNKLITVKHGTDRLIPLFQLADNFDLIPEWEPIYTELAKLKESDWAKWGWLATPSTWLDDQTPIAAFNTNPDTVLQAAKDRAAAAATIAG